MTIKKNIILIDEIKRNIADDVNISMSNDGKLLYIVYPNSPDSINNISAEIIQNNFEKLISLKSIYSDSDYPIIRSGYASNLFNKFTIIDTTLDNKSVRLRIFDIKFNVIISRKFTEYGSAQDFNGGCFSDDGKYIIITHYEKNKNGISTIGKGIIHLLDSNTLKTIFKYKQNGILYNSPRFFSLRESNDFTRTYIMLLIVEEQIVFNPYKYIIYEVLDNKIQKISEVMLSQMAISFDIAVKKNVAYIAIGTNQKNIKIKSKISNDNNEMKLYRFKNEKTKLLYSKNMMNNINIYLHNKLKYMITFYNKIYTYSGFFSIDKIIKHEKKFDIIENIYSMEGYINFSAKFSQNGKWIIVAGLKNSSNANNIFLYTIIK